MPETGGGNIGMLPRFFMRYSGPVKTVSSSKGFKVLYAYL
jgi:hypothetical protein